MRQGRAGIALGLALAGLLVLAARPAGSATEASRTAHGPDSLPAWLVYLLWDEEFYHVRDLAADPIE